MYILALARKHSGSIYFFIFTQNKKRNTKNLTNLDLLHIFSLVNRVVPLAHLLHRIQVNDPRSSSLLDSSYPANATRK